MNRRFLYVTSALILTAVLATTVIRCEPPALTSFSYIPHERPRVFVAHHPLRALPGQTVTIRLTPDLRAEDGTVETARAGLRRFSATTRDERSCTAQTDGSFACQFTLPAGNDDYVYDGHLVLKNGTRIDVLTAYRFRAAATIGATELLTLREPIAPVKTLAASYRVDAAWVHDPGDGYGFAAFLTDVETGVYTGILADPVYRWRDHQLAFYVYGAPGFTSSYYSGLDTRCGQNPWPAEPSLGASLATTEVLGVLHRHPTSASGVEGTVVAQSPTVFRDCAGDAVRNPALATFSATGGSADTAGVAKHEYGHAAFGFGDEYTESQATRDVAPADLDPPPASCCCASDPGTGPGGGTTPGTTTPGTTTPGTTTPGTTTPGRVGGTVTTPGTGTTPGGGIDLPGISQRMCMTAAGQVPVPGSTTGLPSCTGYAFPPQCSASPQGGCPPLIGDCLQATAWLGATAPAGDTSRLNMFPSQAACDAARPRATDHPGVEDPDRALDTSCRQLCGPGMAACPCGQLEGWIVDTNPAAASTPGTVDSMGSVSALRHGGTCAWCVETTLCVRWQRGLGQSADAAWSTCDAPPANATELERQSVSLMRAIFEWLRELTRNWRF